MKSRMKLPVGVVARWRVSSRVPQLKKNRSSPHTDDPSPCSRISGCPTVGAGKVSALFADRLTNYFAVLRFK